MYRLDLSGRIYFFASCLSMSRLADMCFAESYLTLPCLAYVPFLFIVSCVTLSCLAVFLLGLSCLAVSYLSVASGFFMAVSCLAATCLALLLRNVSCRSVLDVSLISV